MGLGQGLLAPQNSEGPEGRLPRARYLGFFYPLLEPTTRREVGQGMSQGGGRRHKESGSGPAGPAGSISRE